MSSELLGGGGLKIAQFINMHSLSVSCAFVAITDWSCLRFVSMNIAHFDLAIFFHSAMQIFSNFVTLDAECWWILNMCFDCHIRT